LASFIGPVVFGQFPINPGAIEARALVAVTSN